ncbi:MAG: protoporphyrinogen oxidase [Planctomycetota bacterium]|jgi:oxygen-dependent protoporphyrinogen oxidase
MNNGREKVVVIGGGISGLTAAYRLESAGAEVTLVEKDARLGGTIRTCREKDFVIEGGPDSFFTQKPWGLQLCRELGMQDRLTPMSRTGYYIYSGNRLHEGPLGMRLGIPTRIRPVLTTKLLSFRARLRMLMERFASSRSNGADESIASFMMRHFGREVMEKLMEPLMGGIYVAPADRLSIRATFPRLVELEREYGSLIKAFLSEARKRKRARAAKRAGDGRPQGPFLTLRGGMAELVEGVASRLKRTRILTGKGIRGIEPGCRVHLSDGTLEADRLLLAVPGPAASELVREFAPELADAIGRIPVVGSATVSLGYRESSFPGPLDGTGFVIPRAERCRVLACTWSSRKFPGRAPPGHVLLRCFFGGADDQAAMSLDDDRLIRIARGELAAILGVWDEPVVAKVFRWPTANPIYEVGHAERIRAVEKLCPPGLHLTGGAFRGIGIPECVRDAGEVVRGILAERSGRVGV